MLSNDGNRMVKDPKTVKKEKIAVVVITTIITIMIIGAVVTNVFNESAIKDIEAYFVEEGISANHVRYLRESERGNISMSYNYIADWQRGEYHITFKDHKVTSIIKVTENSEVLK